MSSRRTTEELDALFGGADELVMHNLRDAARVFGVTADTIRQWCMSGKLTGEQAPGPNGRWTVRIPRDHPLLPGNKPEESVHHYPRVEDPLVSENAALKARILQMEDEIQFLRGQVGQIPELVERVMLASRPALPDPTARRWWYWFWPFERTRDRP